MKSTGEKHKKFLKREMKDSKTASTTKHQKKKQQDRLIKQTSLQTRIMKNNENNTG